MVTIDDALAKDVHDALVAYEKLLDGQLPERIVATYEGKMLVFDHSELFVARKTVKRLLEVFR